MLHDIINNRFARKAIEKGADGLIAGGGRRRRPCRPLSPFALIQEIRDWFDGPLALSGAIATGRAVLAAQAMGADLAYIGSAFIATEEARATDGYKQMIVESGGEDIVYTNLFTGVHGNYLRPSIVAAGLDPDNLPQRRSEEDELRLRRRPGGQGLARHLGLRPGHRRGQGGRAGRRAGRAPAARIRGREGADLRLELAATRVVTPRKRGSCSFHRHNQASSPMRVDNGDNRAHWTFRPLGRERRMR